MNKSEVKGVGPPASQQGKLKCHEAVKDLTQGLGLVRNWYCPVCGAHSYNGLHYTKKQWLVYVNSIVDEGY